MPHVPARRAKPKTQAVTGFRSIVGHASIDPVLELLNVAVRQLVAGWWHGLNPRFVANACHQIGITHRSDNPSMGRQIHPAVWVGPAVAGRAIRRKHGLNGAAVTRKRAVATFTAVVQGTLINPGVNEINLCLTERASFVGWGHEFVRVVFHEDFKKLAVLRVARRDQIP